MQKVVLLVVLIAICGGASIFGESLDFVILLDVSESMLPYFDDTVNYLIRDIVSEHLTTGDAFHLLSFSSLPEIEIIRTISETEDSGAVLARIFLLQPLGQYTDLISALRFLQAYVGRLSIGTDKKILILTDGEHDPPPGSPYPNSADALITQEMSRIAKEMSEEGWDVGLIRFPVDPADTAGGGEESNDQLGASNEASQAGALSENTSTESRVGESGERGSGELLSTDANRDANTIITSDASDLSEAIVGDSNQAINGDSLASGNTGSATKSTNTVDESGAAATFAAVSTDTGNAVTAADSVADRQDDDRRTIDSQGDSDASNVDEGILDGLAKELGVEIVEFTEDSIGSSDLIYEATGAPRLVFPDHLGTVRRSFYVRFDLIPFDDEPLPVEVTSVVSDDIDILAGKVTTTLRGETRKLRIRLNLPKSAVPGELKIPIRIEFADDLRIFPREGVLELELRGGGIDMPRLLRVLGYIGVVIVGIVLLTFAVVFLRRIVIATLTHTTNSPAIRFKEIGPGEPAIEMIVEGQNRKIGTRNIHVIRDRSSRSIGGGNTNFLVFAYPVRSRIAEIRRSGEAYNFVPRHNDARVGSESGGSGEGTIENCIGRSIRIRTVRGHEVTLLFLHYISPLDRINRIMHSIDGPGRSRN